METEQAVWQKMVSILRVLTAAHEKLHLNGVIFESRERRCNVILLGYDAVFWLA